jgi:hypothetical protein
MVGKFEPEMKDVGGVWRKLINKIQNLYVSPHNIKLIKSRRMIWVGHAACTGEIRNTYLH